MDGDSEHKAEALDNGWVLDSEKTGEEDSKTVTLWRQQCIVNCQIVSIFVMFLPSTPSPQPQNCLGGGVGGEGGEKMPLMLFPPNRLLFVDRPC